MRHLIALAGALAVAAVATAAAAGDPAATPTLVGTVGPGYTITLKSGGKAVKTLKAGTYKLTIHDKANIHAFSVDGPNGYSKAFTAVAFVGTKTFTVKLKAGSYKYFCPPHASIMFGDFTVK